MRDAIRGASPTLQFSVSRAADSRQLTLADIQVLGYLLEDLCVLLARELRSLQQHQNLQSLQRKLPHCDRALTAQLSAITFWVCINFAIYTLLLVAFSYRMADTITHDPEQEAKYRFISFQILACAAPFVWVKLLTILCVRSPSIVLTAAATSSRFSARCRSLSPACCASQPSSSPCALTTQGQR